MARKKATKKPTRKTPNALNEVAGLILLGLGILLFLSLVSYDPGDLPTWLPFSKVAPPNSPVHNFIGPIGAVIAGILYFLIGAASYLVAVVLLGYGGAKLLAVNIHIRPKMLWIGLFIASGTCLIHMQPWFLHGWRGEFNIHGAGGWLGYVLGEKVFVRFFGLVGTAILLSALYLASIILMTGLRPIYILRRCREVFAAYLEQREERLREKANVRERLDIDRKKLEREERKLQKQLKKKQPAARVEKSPSNASQREINIIDSTVPQTGKCKAIDSKLPEPEITLGSNAAWENYKLPSIDILNEIDPSSRQAADPEELRGIQNTLIDTLAQFNIEVTAGDITRGPTITRFEVYPARGVRVDKIVNLERDLARATSAEQINILAPIPGKDTVGIEIANSKKVMVTLREIMETDTWHNSKARIPMALGKDVYGKTIIADLAQMPHCLVAGTTGSGKSVCINSIVASILYRFTPDQLRLIMIDPKVVELQVYNKLPHLIVPVVTDPKKVLMALRWIINEMEKRYKIFAKVGVRNIVSFNAYQEKNRPKSAAELKTEDETNPTGNKEETPTDEAARAVPPPEMRVPRDSDVLIPDHMPYIVVIVDELADLMQTAPADVESGIARITQMARAAGIHMIIATQTPRADVITGVIKANVPSRIAFQVASKLDSRVILDENGAERLLGQGDMLYLPPGTSRLTRSQGVFVTDEEISDLVDFVADQSQPSYEPEIHEKLENTSEEQSDVSDEDEELVTKCLEIIRQEKKASTSMLQRRLRLGYTRAARIVDILEERGIVGPSEGAKPREILIDLDDYAPDDDQP